MNPTAPPTANPTTPPTGGPTTQSPHLDYPTGYGATGTPFSPLTPHIAFLPGPVGYALTGGALPPGLTLDPSTGVISGTPTQSGIFQASVTATGAGATATGVVAIEVTNPASLLDVSLKPTDHSSKLKLTVYTPCPGQFTFRLQKRSTSSSNGGSDNPTASENWRTLGTTYRTAGTSHTRTVNQPRGTYRAVVTGACLHADTLSPTAYLHK